MTSPPHVRARVSIVRMTCPIKRAINDSRVLVQFEFRLTSVIISLCFVISCEIAHRRVLLYYLNLKFMRSSSLVEAVRLLWAFPRSMLLKVEFDHNATV